MLKSPRCVEALLVLFPPARRHPPRRASSAVATTPHIYDRRSWLIIAGLCLAVAIGILPANAQVSVTQEHNHLSRDGLYIDSVFTPANAANLMRDLGFDGTISGNVYAQPLYIEGGPNGPMVIAVTESNNVVRARR